MQYIYDNYDEILYTGEAGCKHEIRKTVDRNTHLNTNFYFSSERFHITQDSQQMMTYLINKLAAANEVHSAYALESMKNITIAISKLLKAVDDFCVTNEKDLNV